MDIDTGWQTRVREAKRWVDVDMGKRARQATTMPVGAKVLLVRADGIRPMVLPKKGWKVEVSLLEKVESPATNAAMARVKVGHKIMALRRAVDLDSRPRWHRKMA